MKTNVTYLNKLNGSVNMLKPVSKTLIVLSFMVTMMSSYIAMDSYQKIQLSKEKIEFAKSRYIQYSNANKSINQKLEMLNSGISTLNQADQIEICFTSMPKNNKNI